jgi:sugar phosphate permease
MSIFGRIIPGTISDNTGAFNVQIVFMAVMTISVLEYWTPSTNEAAIITFGMFFGFISGAIVSLFTACCVVISPIKKID